MTPGLSVIARCRGRALYLGKDGAVYVGRGYRIYRSDDWGKSWALDSQVPAPAWRAGAALVRPGARLLRHYVAGLAVLSDGTRIAVARDGLYRARRGEVRMTRAFAVTRGSRPLNVTADRDDRVLFGEYGDNAARHEIHLYVSRDRAERFDVGYTFPRGAIRHVHNVLYDRFLDKYWVLVGDYGAEPGIGLLDRDLSHLEWVLQGSQSARAVAAVVEEDCLLFGTDTELELNRILRLDKGSGRTSALADIEGTSLHATRFGAVRAISTCVEPSRINRSSEARLYVSTDTERWSAAAAYPKDPLPFRLFQFGTLVLPHSEHAGSRGLFSGQAVSGLDGQALLADFTPILRAPQTPS